MDGEVRLLRAVTKRAWKLFTPFAFPIHLVPLVMVSESYSVERVRFMLKVLLQILLFGSLSEILFVFGKSVVPMFLLREIWVLFAREWMFSLSTTTPMTIASSCCGFEVCRPLFMLLGILNSLGDVQNSLPCGSIVVSSFRTFKVLQRDFESLDCGKTNLVPIPWFHKNFWRAIHHEVQKSVKNQLWIMKLIWEVSVCWSATNIGHL